MRINKGCTNRGDKGEEKVIAVLNKYKKPFLLINNLMLEDKSGHTHQCDHIFINEQGIFVIETKNYFGNVSNNCNDSIWIRSDAKKTNTFGNPIYQNISHIRVLKSILKNDYNFVSVVVFVQNNAPYMPDDNVINLEDLMLFLNEYPGKKILSEETIKAIYTTLLFAESDKSQKSHLDHINEIKKKRIENQKMIAKALESRICPKCKTPLKEENGILYCPNKKCKFKINLM